MSVLMTRTLDWQTPWLWPWRLRCLAWGCLWVIGVFAFVGLAPDDAWSEQRALQTQHEATLQTLATLQQQTLAKAQQLASLRHASPSHKTDTLPALMTMVQASAQTEGLAVQAVVPQVLTQGQALAQGQTLALQVRGRSADVWDWLQQVGQRNPELVLHGLDMQAGTADHVDARVVWQWTPVTGPSRQAAALEDVQQTAEHIGFDVHTWAQVQRHQASQHPSYVRWVAPELNRSRHMLERFASQSLRYEGVISRHHPSQNTPQALIRIMDPSAAGHPVVRVGVGAYMGHNFGQIQAIAPDHVLLRELLRDDSGVWAPHWLKLPLGGASTDTAVPKTVSKNVP